METLFLRQRAIFFEEDVQSGAAIGHVCTVVEFNPYSQRKYPHDPDRWWVRIYLPHRKDYLEVQAGELMGTDERDDSPLPPPNFPLEIASAASDGDCVEIAGLYRIGWRWRHFVFQKRAQPASTYHLYEQGKLFYYVPTTERLNRAYVDRALEEIFARRAPKE